jgi:tRNA(Ser,Leu) C12 N-acetylase TAN1
MPALPDWNVVVTVYGHEFRRACRLLKTLAPVSSTGYYNVVVMRVGDVRVFVDQLSELAHDRPELLDVVARVAPAMQAFDFQSPEEFEHKARETVLGWAPALAAKSFFVRLHRRGFKGRLPSHEEERFLDKVILDALAAQGSIGSVLFENPDVVIDIETVDNRAGLALWTRDDLRNCPLLRTR